MGLANHSYRAYQLPVRDPCYDERAVPNEVSPSINGRQPLAMLIFEYHASYVYHNDTPKQCSAFRGFFHVTSPYIALSRPRL